MADSLTESQVETTAAPAPASSLLRGEDWLAVWCGFAVIGLVLALQGGPISLEPPVYKWASPDDLHAKVLAADNLEKMGMQAAVVFALACLGVGLMRGQLARFALGFWVVYLLATIALIIAGNGTVNYWGLEYVIFALALGLLISNVLSVPVFVQEAVRTEFFIKTGLVILGAGILIGEVLSIGYHGMIQALGVVVVVWFICFWVARRLRVDDEFATMLSTAVAICGVSAAIAACGAIQGDRRKLSYVTSLVLIVAVPMMVLMPMIAKETGMPDMVAGAWIGGTLDTSGSVVAAGGLISPLAEKTGVIVKLSQNVLIGLAAFVLAAWWAFRDGSNVRESEDGDASADNAPVPSPSAWVIWERFPKFVLGFVAASILFSVLVETAPELVKPAGKTLASYRTLWFALAFACIGLETRFVDLFKKDGLRPAAAFIVAQAFNVIWTLALAYLLFDYLQAK